MRTVKSSLLIILFIYFLLPSGVTAAINQSSDKEETIHIPLARNDEYISGIFMPLTFDEEQVKAVLEKHNVKLPDERPTGIRVGYASSDETVVMFQKIPDKDAVFLTVDANRNYDLTDDEAVEVPSRLEQAKKVVADYELPWQQVMEGKGYFLPIFQVFGLLPERKMTFPVYIVIDSEGIVRYATNDYTNAERSLDKLLDQKGDSTDLLLPMKKENRERASGGYGVTFTPESVQKKIQENQVKLPENLDSDDHVGIMHNKTLVIVKRSSSPDALSIIVDSDRDSDLTNDEEKELRIPVDHKDADQTRIYLKATYSDGSWEYHPLFFFVFPGYDPSAPPRISYGLGYAYQTTFFQDGREYQVTIQDPTLDGIFEPTDIENQNFLNLAVKKGDKWEYIHYGFELIPAGKQFYRAHAVAEDGSWIELRKSHLQPAAIGKQAPDFRMIDTEGKAFRLSDFKGKVVLLDFWPSWCKPCIVKFPDIKKLIQQYSEEKLMVIGINLDEPGRVEKAKEVIAEYQLPWRQVVAGKGYSNPAYQVYGRLPEHKMVVPAYIVIDTEGIVRYATNDYQKVENILNKLLLASSEGKDMLPVPLNLPSPISFSISRFVFTEVMSKSYATQLKTRIR